MPEILSDRAEYISDGEEELIKKEFVLVYWRWNLMTRRVFLFSFNFICLRQL